MESVYGNNNDRVLNMDRCLFRRNSGNALAQYAIILALIAAVIVPGFFFLGNNIVDSFKDFYVCLGGDPDNIDSASSSSESLINTDGDLLMNLQAAIVMEIVVF